MRLNHSSQGTTEVTYLTNKVTNEQIIYRHTHTHTQKSVLRYTFGQNGLCCNLYHLLFIEYPHTPQSIRASSHTTLVCLCCGIMTQVNLLMSCQASQLTYSHCSWEGLDLISYLVHMYKEHRHVPETDNCPSWINRKGRRATENTSASISMEVIHSS